MQSTKIGVERRPGFFLSFFFFFPFIYIIHYISIFLSLKWPMWVIALAPPHLLHVRSRNKFARNATLFFQIFGWDASPTMLVAKCILQTATLPSPPPPPHARWNLNGSDPLLFLAPSDLASVAINLFICWFYQPVGKAEEKKKKKGTEQHYCISLLASFRYYPSFHQVISLFQTQCGTINICDKLEPQLSVL